MKKGFTLIELLAILALLGVILLVSVPNIISSNKKIEENNYQQYLNNIKSSAEVYIEAHGDKYQTLKTTPGTTETINVDNLIKGNYIQGTLKNPRTSETLEDENGTITVTNKDGELVYTYNP